MSLDFQPFQLEVEVGDFLAKEIGHHIGALCPIHTTKEPATCNLTFQALVVIGHMSGLVYQSAASRINA